MCWQALLLLSLAGLALSHLLPICDPLIEGFEANSCLRVSIIYDPHYEGDLDHCVCDFIVRQLLPGLEQAGPLYTSRLKRCAFGEENDAMSAWNRNNCNETIPSPALRGKFNCLRAWAYRMVPCVTMVLFLEEL